MKQKLLIILMSLLPTVTVWATVGDLIIVDNLNYTVTSEEPKTVELTGYSTKPRGELVIPSTVNGYSVTSIGEGAFGYCYKLESIEIPSSVTKIGSYAFFDCRVLSSVIIPDGVTAIEKWTFYGCIKLTSVYIPNGLQSIGSDAFTGCEILPEINIPPSVTSIGASAFESCKALEKVNIYANALSTYGKDAFKNANSAIQINVFSENVEAFKAGWGTYSSKISDFTAEDLTVEGVSANQNPSVISDNWATYYHPASNVKVNTSDVEIYIATLSENGTFVTLAKVEGNNIIKAGQAVMLKAADAGALSLELTPDAATGNYTGNDLKGGSAVASGKIAYTLAAMNNRMGFYKFAGSALNPNKAHLELPASASIRQFVALDEEEATALSEELRVKSEEFDDAWYDLNGRRIANGQKPTAKGVFLHNGRKEVVR
jgi:hypothetical protein